MGHEIHNSMRQMSRIVAVLSLKPSAKKAKEKEFENLTAEFKVKRDNILAQPELVERAEEKIQSYMIREHLLEHTSAIEAYQKGGMVKAEIDGILASEFCQELLAPVVEAYEKEKARILGKVG